jgi:hypothetical protein
MRAFAKQLLTWEMKANHHGTDSELPAIFRVCERLRLCLTGLSGICGFRALLSRALILSEREVPWMKAIQAKLDGSLGGIDEIKERLPQEEIFQGGLVLVAELVRLMVGFIGEDLTLRLVREVWPGASLDNVGQNEESKNEQTK